MRKTQIEIHQGEVLKSIQHGIGEQWLLPDCALTAPQMSGCVLGLLNDCNFCSVKRGGNVNTDQEEAEATMVLIEKSREDVKNGRVSSSKKFKEKLAERKRLANEKTK